MPETNQIYTQLYGILEQMVEAVNQEYHGEVHGEIARLDKVARLNNLYVANAITVYQSPPTELDCQYDRCRESCIMAVLSSLTADQRKMFAANAQEIFSGIERQK